MSWTNIIIIALVWAACGYLAFGYSFGYYQKEYPTIAKSTYPKDLKFAYCQALAGPIALLVILYMGLTKHGRKYK